jgi:hypothetical protein
MSRLNFGMMQLTSVGPNATLVQGDLIDFAAKLKSERDGDTTSLARSSRTCYPLRGSLTSIACTFVRTCSPPVSPSSLGAPASASPSEARCYRRGRGPINLRARLINLPFRLVPIRRTVFTSPVHLDVKPLALIGNASETSLE